MKKTCRSSVPARIEILLEEQSAELVIKCLLIEELRRKNIFLEFRRLDIKTTRRESVKKLHDRLHSYKAMIENGLRVGIMILIDRDDTADVVFRLRPITRTFASCSGAALCPPNSRSTKIRHNGTHPSRSITGRIVAGVCPKQGLPGSVPTRRINGIGAAKALLDAFPSGAQVLAADRAYDANRFAKP